MKLIKFKEHTHVIARDQPQYHAMPLYRFNDPDQGRMACCWQLTWKERFAVLWTGKIWQQMLTFNGPIQPQKLTVEKPDMP